MTHSVRDRFTGSELLPGILISFNALFTLFLPQATCVCPFSPQLSLFLPLSLAAVINRCDLIVPDIVQSLLAVWKHRKLVEFCQIPETGGDGNGGSGGEEEEIERLIMAEQNEDGERSLVDEADIQRIRDRKQQEGECEDFFLYGKIHENCSNYRFC